MKSRNFDRRRTKLPGYSRTSNPKFQLYNPTLDFNPDYHVYSDTDVVAVDTDPVQIFKDITGTYSLTQATEANRPLLDTTGNHNTLTFDGSNDYLASGAIATLDDPPAMAIFLVVSHTDANQVLLSLNYDSGALGESDRLAYISTDTGIVSANWYTEAAALKTTSGPSTPTEPCIIALIHNQTFETLIYVNGKYHGTVDFSSATPNTLVRLTLGVFSHNFGSPSNMSFYRLLIYTRELSFTELTTITSNLATIYNINAALPTTNYLPDLHFRADQQAYVSSGVLATDGQTVEIWKDLINNVELTQATADSRPTLSVLSDGSSELVFNNDYLQKTSVTQNNGDIHTFIIKARHSNTGTQYVMSMSQNSVQAQYLRLASSEEEGYGRTTGDSNVPVILENNTPDTEYHTYIIVLREDNNVQIYKTTNEGIKVGSANGTTKAFTTNSSLTIGDFYASLGTSPLIGGIKEILYYNRELTKDEIHTMLQKISGSLQESLPILDINPINNSYKDAAVDVAVASYLISATDLTITTPFTVSGWFKFPGSAPTDTAIVSNADFAGQTGTFILGTLSGFFIFIVKDGSGDVAALESSVAVQSDTWYFVTGYYDGTNIGIQVDDNAPVETAISQLNNNYLPLYVNGVEVATTPTGGVNAQFDSLAIYNAYVDPDTLWNSGDGYTYDELPSTTNLLHFWNFDEADGGPYVDSHGSRDLTTPGTATRVPGIISSLATDGDPVAFVTPTIGNYTFTQPTYTKRPTYSSDGLVFDGVDDFLIYESFPLRTFTIFVKFTCPSDASNPMLFWYGDDLEASNPGFFYNTEGILAVSSTTGIRMRNYASALDDEEHTVAIVYNGDSQSLRLVDGIEFLGDDDQNAQNCIEMVQNFRIGITHIDELPFEGTVSRLVIYNKALSTQELTNAFAEIT